MTYSFAIRNTLIISFALLACNSTVNAQDGVTAVAKTRPASVNESKSIVPSTNVMPAKKHVGKSNLVKKKPSSEVPQARPGERVSNPDHLILNSDTTLGGVLIKGSKLTDFGYLGPGDMRTHLWNGHSRELIENGITENKLMAMTVPEVQHWHNYFHGGEDSPEHAHDGDEQSHPSTIAQQPTSYSAITYAENPVDGTIAYENSGFVSSEYPQFQDGQPEIIYPQGTSTQSSASHGFGPRTQSAVVVEGVIESGPSDR